MSNRAARTWTVTHVVFPLLPFFLGGFVRLLAGAWHFDWSTFSASDLAICLAVLCLCVNQSLVREERLLDNQDKKEDAATESVLFLVLGITLLALFSVVVAFDTAVTILHLEQLAEPLHFFQFAVAVLAIVTIRRAARACRSYSLRGRLSA